jgi:RND family efflux transporter MFP subunit
VTKRSAPVLLVALGVFTSACSPDKAAVNDQKAVPKGVRVAAVELSTDPEVVNYSAIIAPNAQVDLAFRVSGYVVELLQTKGADGRVRPLQPGSAVTAGTVLARIRPTDYQAVVDKARGAHDEAQAGIQAAEAQLVQAQAVLAQAELDFNRVSTLWNKESITKPAYDASKARLDIARATVDANKAAIAAAHERTTSAAAQMREAQIALADTELRAPFNGILLERRLELGALAAAGAPAFTLADLESVKARFSVPDFALAGFHQGQTLMLSVLAFPGQNFSGRVLSIAAAADPKARSFEIEVAIQNASLKLRSGMIASVRAAAAESPQPQLRIPASALVHDPAGNRYLVYAVEQNSGQAIAKAIPVEPGPLTGNQVVVRSGLQPGQRIVVLGANLLQPGDPVREIE